MQHLPIGLHNTTPPDVRWIYMALEHIQQSCSETRKNLHNQDEWDANTTLEVNSLLQLLAMSRNVLEMPPIETFPMILRALSAPGDISLVAFKILHQRREWFIDLNLGPVMLRYSVWYHLGRIALEYRALVGPQYLEIGRDIANTPEWKPSMFADLPTWITVFAGDDWGRSFCPEDTFISVIRSIWVPHFYEREEFIDKTGKAWALSIAALSNTWSQLDSTVRPTGWHQILQLARCTTTTSLRINYVVRNVRDWDKGRFFAADRGVYSARLGFSLVMAAQNIGRLELSQENRETVDRFARSLDALGQKIGTEFEPRAGEVQLGGSVRKYRDWRDLEMALNAEWEDLEVLLNPSQMCSGTT
ncbi:hypothetical protein DFH09DRAFT_1308521 [Mycena vulgaris]|nr:hypothetical protein DFH09DRAFT_1308521 [Mycena vulgaris]